jgi:hypothetical protein
VIRLVERMVAFMSRKSERKTEIAAARVPGQVQRLALFGPPLLLEGEDASAYDELLARICAAVKPVDIIDEIFIADIVSLEWEVLRWRRLKWTLMQETGLKALENFLAGKLDYDLYSERVVDRLTKILRHNLPEEHADSAQTLARECARNEQHAVDTIDEVLACINLDMGDIQCDARADNAQELVRDYLRRKPDAVTRVDEVLTSTGVSMDTFMTKAGLALARQAAFFPLAAVGSITNSRGEARFSLRERGPGWFAGRCWPAHASA